MNSMKATERPDAVSSALWGSGTYPDYYSMPFSQCAYYEMARNEERRFFQLEQGSQCINALSCDTCGNTGTGRKFAEEFLSILKRLDFEYGYVSEAERYLERQLEKGVRDLITSDVAELFYCNMHDERLAEYILYVVSSLPFEDMMPYCVELPKKALKSESEILKEGGIRCFEAWEKPEFLPLLENVECGSGWLCEYLHSVIEGLKEIRRGK